MPRDYRRALLELKARSRNRAHGRGRIAGTRPMGKPTGFLEVEREDRHYEKPAERRHRLGASSSSRCRRRRCARRRRAAWIAASRSVTRAARSTTSSRTGTIWSIATSGGTRSTSCTRPTIFPSSPAASARRRARPPARSTSTTTRSPSKPSNARSSTAAGTRAGSSPQVAGAEDRQDGRGGRLRAGGHGLRPAAGARRPRA